ncbi:MAG: SPOR domain-containing protein [Hydrogenophilales bacterium 17-61-9]|nr:MAG: SPOR domain-containing protein [Hydrogenophilales bacterium 17-61-9]
MPLPSNENDLKRRARRRLIGAVGLTLLAVIVLPLLLEDEPPPASSLAVRMAAKPALTPVPAPPPAQQNEAVVAAAPPVLPQPEAPPAPDAKPEPRPASQAVPVKPEPPRPTPKPAPLKPVEAPAAQSAAASGMFVVQLAALSDAAKAETLKTRAAQAGLPAFTDKVGNLTRVRVGPYATRAAAVAAAVKLAENNLAGQVLTQ